MSLDHIIRDTSILEAWERARNPSFAVGRGITTMSLGGKNLLDQVYRMSAAGSKLETIAASLGVTLQVFKEYFESELGLDAKLVYEKAKAEGIIRVESNAFELAQSKDVKAVKFWLENKNPDEWKDRKEETKNNSTIVFLESCEREI